MTKKIYVKSGSLTPQAAESIASQAIANNFPRELVIFPDISGNETEIHKKAREQFNDKVNKYALEKGIRHKLWFFDYSKINDLPFAETTEYKVATSDPRNSVKSKSSSTVEIKVGTLREKAAEELARQANTLGVSKELVLFPPPTTNESDVHRKAREEHNKTVREFAKTNNLADQLKAFDYIKLEGNPFTEKIEYITAIEEDVAGEYEFIERDLKFMCRPEPHDPETPEEKAEREKSNKAAEGLSIRTIIKEKNRAAKRGEEYVHNPSHDVWWQDIGEKVFKPEIFKAELLPKKENETPEETVARDTENFRRMAKADRKTILAERRAIEAGLWVKPEGHETPSSVAHLRKGRETAKTLTGLHDPSKGRRDIVDKVDREYKVYYKEIDPKTIFNYVGPWSYTQAAIRPTELHATEEEVIKKRNAKDGFYDKLLASVEKNGFQDPIVINCGGGISVFTSNLLPKSFMDDIENRLICMFMGGSRLWAAQQLELPKIPCIISDYSGKFEGEQELNTVEEIAAKFTQKPTDLRFTRLGIRYEPLRIK